MTRLQTNLNRTPNEESEDQLAEQVGQPDDTELPEESQDEPEGDDEQADELDEDSADQQGGDDSELDDEPPQTGELDEIKSQMGQMAEAIGKLTDIVSKQATSPQNQTRQPTARPPAPKSERDLENMSQAELAKYSIQQAAGHGQFQLQRFGQGIADGFGTVDKKFALYGAALDKLLADNPEYRYVREALDRAMRQPGADVSATFEEAYTSAKGNAAQQENERLRKERNRDRKASKKRAQKARRGQEGRGTTPPVRKPLARNRDEAIEQAIAELGG